MPSLRAMTRDFAVLLLSITQLSSANPLPGHLKSAPAKFSPTLPSTGGPTSLPSTNLTLQYIALGRGIQNYTCASLCSAPVALGAVATLYDATTLAKTNEALLNTMPGKAVMIPPSRDGYDLPPPANNLRVLGHHYFAADSTPTFNLTAVNKILFGKKNGDIPAPVGAPKGPSGNGAVDWLSLVEKPDYSESVGLGQVYRVETAGGNAPAACSSTGVVSVQYAAEYWFYA